MGRPIHKISFIVLFSLLVLSLVGMHIPLWKSVKLFGQSSYVMPDYSLKTFTNGKFQKKLDQWHSDHFFLREDAIRVSSQLNYSLYNTSISKEVFIGKDGHLFHTSGLKEYNANSRWTREVKNRIQTLERFSDYLESKGKHLFVIIPPDKMRARPEFLPDDVNMDSLKNAYYHYRGFLENTSLHVIDLSDYLRNHSEIPSSSLFPKYGFHWNLWPALVGYNYVISEIENVTGDSLPKATIDTLRFNDSPGLQDIDLWRSLNIFTGIDPEPIEIPTYHFSEAPSPKKVLVSGDSFFLTWKNAGLMDSSLAEHEYWYYSEYIFKGKDDENKIYTKDLDFDRYIEQFDMIWLMAHEPNLNAFPFGFEHFIEDHISYE